MQRRGALLLLVRQLLMIGRELEARDFPVARKDYDEYAAAVHFVDDELAADDRVTWPMRKAARERYPDNPWRRRL